MANIIVFGGTGYAGSAIVKEAAARGHKVTSVSRAAGASPAAGVTYATAPAAEAQVPIGKGDVVVATLSPRGDNVGKLPDLYRELAQRAAKAGARFIAIGGFTCLRPAEGAPRMADGDQIPPQYRQEALEMYQVLKDLEAGRTGADWLFVSPAMEFGSYAPGKELGRYRTSGEVALFDANGKSAISGADFARAVVDEIEKPTRHKAQIHFAY